MDSKPKQAQSPKALAWKRFRSNKLGMASCGFVILWALLALFAYLFIPDKTPNANRQILEISTKKPGFEVDMLMIPKETPPQKTPFFDFLFNGRPDDCIYLPFDSIRVDKERTTVYLYQGEESSTARTEVFDNKELLINKDSLSGLTRQVCPVCALPTCMMVRPVSASTSPLP